MGSCAGSIKIAFLRIKHRLHDNEDIISRLVQDFMVYAYHAEVKNEDLLTQVQFLDEVSSTMTRSAKKRWGSSDWIAGVWPRVTELDFLDLATIYGLRGYVEEKLRQYDITQIESIATELLRYLLPIGDRYVKLGIPLPRFEMVSLLLKYTARPSGGKSAPSPLDNLADQILHMAAVQAPWNKNCNPRVLHLRYVEILRMLIPENPCPLEDMYELDATDDKSINLIQVFLAKYYPPFAGIIIEGIRSLRLPSNRKRQRDPHNSSDVSNDGDTVDEDDTMDDDDTTDDDTTGDDDDSSADFERPAKRIK
jgi:hypothetical protein